MMGVDKEELEATRRLREKTADKMFKELGYAKDKVDETEGYAKVISPYKKQKGIIFENNFIKELIINLSYYDKEGNFHYKQVELSEKELQAINEKCKELGWL